MPFTISHHRRFLGIYLFMSPSPSVADPACVYKHSMGLSIGLWWKTFYWSWSVGHGKGNL